MVVGPPGTGKTDTAVQILNVLYHNCPSQRTLIITHSNQALNDLFEKIMQVCYFITSLFHVQLLLFCFCLWFSLLLFFREMYLHVIYSDLVKENRSLLLILILVGKVALMQCLLDG
jgi:hypothetical protein